MTTSEKNFNVVFVVSDRLLSTTLLYSEYLHGFNVVFHPLFIFFCAIQTSQLDIMSKTHWFLFLFHSDFFFLLSKEPIVKVNVKYYFAYNQHMMGLVPWTVSHPVPHPLPVNVEMTPTKYPCEIWNQSSPVITSTIGLPVHSLSNMTYKIELNANSSCMMFIQFCSYGPLLYIPKLSNTKWGGKKKLKIKCFCCHLVVRKKARDTPNSWTVMQQEHWGNLIRLWAHHKVSPLQLVMDGSVSAADNMTTWAAALLQM